MEVDEIEDFLEHHGIKGQKWGIRNEQRLQRLRRVASGKGSAEDNTRVASGQSGISLIRAKGSLKRAAANDATRLAKRKKRIQAGRATVADILATHGGLSIANFGGTG